MKVLVKTLALTAALISGSPAFSMTPTEIFANCLADSLNGKERKNLAKWIFLSITVHPEIKSYANVSAKDKGETDKYVGELVTRLLTEECPRELKAANDSNPLAVQKGFEMVGQVAMQELMTNQETMAALTGYVQYADQEKIARIIAQK